MGKRMRLYEALIMLLVAWLIVCALLAVHEAKSDGELVYQRTLQAVEGHGGLCAILYTRGSGIGQRGSGSISCDWERSYRGDWRPVTPRSQ